MTELIEGAAARLLAQRGRSRRSTRSCGTCARPTRLWSATTSKLQAHYRIQMNQLAHFQMVNTSLSQPGRATQSDHGHHPVLELIPGQGRRQRRMRHA
ncbi:hypothetical protein [Streptomyces sp. TLI_185]|uniref:hypothetical protein n=1 Tax=Streptomyces sp. TLI_185 TaxID=2485151 RepID=UPI0021A3EEFD|nr:hypothetical protein [Streptomyces sp. TLI_185]